MAPRYTPLSEIKIPTDIGMSEWEGESRYWAEQRRKLEGDPPKRSLLPWRRWRARRRAGR